MIGFPEPMLRPTQKRLINDNYISPATTITIPHPQAWW